jgi:hypothetical protein
MTFYLGEFLFVLTSIGMATSTQDMVRPGECVDVYYYDSETSKRQCFPTTQNTKFVQAFQNLTGGSQVFTIPPNQGVQDIVLEMVIAGLGAQVGLALPRGWGYALIKQVSFRYGGSSQYFMTGDQLLQLAVRRQPNRQAANDILTLGGNYASSATSPDLSVNQYASVVLTLPHSVPSGVGKQNPLPSDLLTQQVQITVELNPISSVFTTNAGGSAAPTQLSAGSFVVQQVLFNNMGDALARRVDMSVNAYSFPCEFVQQKQNIPLQSSANPQEIVLTGFRSGEVKAIHCWLTRSSDTSSAAAGYNPFLWYLPSLIQMTYAGDVYARYENASSPLWNLINGNKTPVLDNLDITNGAPPTTANFLSTWIELPFAQTYMEEDSHKMLIHGKPITNGIVNLTITTPTAQSDWVLNVSYIYNSTLLFSQGTADYVF